MRKYRLPVLSTFFVVAVIGAVLAIYWPGLAGGYLFDDVHTIQKNEHLKVDSLDFQSLYKAANSFIGKGRQISMASFSLNYYFFGDSTWHYKLVNLLIHILTGLTLYLFGLRLFALPAIGEYLQRATTLSGRQLAFFLMSLWLVAPINLTAVLYISQRMTLLAALFTALGCLFYVIWRSDHMHRRFSLVTLFAGLAGFTLLGYFSKENGVLLLLYVFLIELVVLRFRVQGEVQKKLVAVYLIGISLVIIAIAYKFSQHPGWISDSYEKRNFSLAERVMTQFRALVFYLWQIVSPVNAKLGLWHDDFVVSTGLLSPATTLLSIAAILTMLLTGLFTLARAPVICFGIFWFFVGHSMESTFIALEIMHEHRNYLASFGILLVLVVLIFQLSIRQTLKISLLSVLILAHGFVLHQRVLMWSNDFYHTIVEAINHPKSGTAHYDLGRRYYSLALNDVEWAGEKAREALEIGSQIDPYAITGELLLAILAARQKIDYDPVWLQRAAGKLTRYPHSALSKSALKGFYACLKDQVCKLPQADVRQLFESAMNTEESHLMTTAAAYFIDVEKDYKMAELAFQHAWEVGDAGPVLSFNYIRVLYLLQKQDQACQVFAEFKARQFGHLMLFESDINEIEQILNGCTQ